MAAEPAQQDIKGRVSGRGQGARDAEQRGDPRRPPSARMRRGPAPPGSGAGRRRRREGRGAENGRDAGQDQEAAVTAQPLDPPEPHGQRAQYPAQGVARVEAAHGAAGRFPSVLVDAQGQGEQGPHGQGGGEDQHSRLQEQHRDIEGAADRGIEEIRGGQLEAQETEAGQAPERGRGQRQLDRAESGQGRGAAGVRPRVGHMGGGVAAQRDASQEHRQ